MATRVVLAVVVLRRDGPICPPRSVTTGAEQVRVRQAPYTSVAQRERGQRKTPAYVAQGAGPAAHDGESLPLRKVTAVGGGARSLEAALFGHPLEDVRAVQTTTPWLPSLHPIQVGKTRVGARPNKGCLPLLLLLAPREQPKPYIGDGADAAGGASARVPVTPPDARPPRPPSSIAAGLRVPRGA